MSLAEQEEEAREQAIQEELLKQLEKEEAIGNADILEERRANAEREKLKELRKASDAQPPRSEDNDNDNVNVNKNENKNGERKEEAGNKEESRPYRRDYSIPVKSHPYGPWQTVQKT